MEVSVESSIFGLYVTVGCLSAGIWIAEQSIDFVDVNYLTNMMAVMFYQNSETFFSFFSIIWSLIFLYFITMIYYVAVLLTSYKLQFSTEKDLIWLWYKSFILKNALLKLANMCELKYQILFEKFHHQHPLMQNSIEFWATHETWINISLCFNRFLLILIKSSIFFQIDFNLILKISFKCECEIFDDGFLQFVNSVHAVALF